MATEPTSKIHLLADGLGRPLRCNTPSDRTRKVAIPHAAIASRQRNRVERCCGRLEHVRRFATRLHGRAGHFAGFVRLAAAMIRMQ